MAETGAVFGIGALIGLAGIGFMMYRFYKAIKARKADRETEEAAREAARVRVRVDDDDDRYGTASNPFGMMEYPHKPSLLESEFDSGADGGFGMRDFDGGRSAMSMNPFVHQYQQSIQRSGSPIKPPPYDAFDVAERGHSTLSPRPSISSIGSREHLLMPMARSETPTGVSLSKQPSTGPVWSGRSTPVLLSNPESHTQLPSQLSQPPAPLPEAFGEGETDRATPPVARSLGDYEDYNGTIGRVLKIANE